MGNAGNKVLDQQSEQRIRDALVRDGFAAPVRLFSPDQCAMIVRHWKHVKKARVGQEWWKDWAARDRFFHDLARRPLLLSMLRQALGNDIILWGARVVERSPGQVHHWHTDIESSVSDRFVSVWIGLENTTAASALFAIPGSHRYGKPVQQAAYEHGAEPEARTNDAVLGWAREFDPSAEIVQPSMTDGDAFVFDGRLWHGSNNQGDGRRKALLLQYASADQKVRQPEGKAGGKFEWPFPEGGKSPPVVVISGKAGAVQDQVMPRPSAGRNSHKDLPIVCQPLDLPLPDDREKGWRPHPILRGATPNADWMSAHVSVLSPGHCPHPPHVHVEEEVLVVLDGEAEILIGDSVDPEEARVERVPAGAFSYYPAYQHHTIRNPGPGNVTYLMFKWRSAPAETQGQAKTGIFRFSDVLTGPPAKKYQTQKFFEQPTGYLKRLHAHITAIEPGGGYAPHSDKHDVAIIVLSGRVRAAGTTLGPCGLFYFPAGTLHGMENVGDAPARYLVFEFHAPALNPEWSKPAAAAKQGGKPKKQKKRSWIVRQLDAFWRWVNLPLTRKIDRAVDRRLRDYFGDDFKRIRKEMEKRKKQR